MHLVVCDANVLLAGLFDPDSLYSKILAVFSYGNLHEQTRQASSEREAVEQLLAETGGEAHGLADLDLVEERARSKIARMEEYLPAVTPTDWGLVISPHITKEVEDNALSLRSKKLGGQTAKAARAAVNAALSISARQVVHGFDGPIPEYTEGRDRSDDPVIHTAILSRADWVFSQDKRHVSLDHRRPTIYRHSPTGRQAGAVTVSYLTRKLLCAGLHFTVEDLKSIDGGRAIRAAVG